MTDAALVASEVRCALELQRGELAGAKRRGNRLGRLPGGELYRPWELQLWLRHGDRTRHKHRCCRRVGQRNL